VGDTEREEHQQVEVCDPQGPAKVEEAEEEEERKGDPDVRRVEYMAELALVAASHRPGDLVAGPRLRDIAAEAVDLHLRDLGAVVVLVTDLPQRVIGDLNRRIETPMAGGHLGDNRVGVGGAQGLLGRDLEVLRRGRDRLRRSRRLSRGGAGSDQADEGGEPGRQPD
jgi:hypothetical protein